MVDTDRLIADLTRPGAWPRPPARVEALQTHISLLLFGDDRVYKIKKAVDLGFVDFRTLQRRRHFCREEVRLNRRLARGVHLGVVPITEDPEGRLRLEGEGAPLEWAVEMVRLPGDRMLARLLDSGQVDNRQMEEIASILARFHARVPTGEGVDEHGRPRAVSANVLDNFRETREHCGVMLSERLHGFLEQVSRVQLESCRDLMQRRVGEGRVREGHGDLHAGNICFTRDGVVIYDCIEFSRRLRCGDVAADVAFLAMDLDRRGFAGFGGFLAHRYARLAGDPDLPGVLPLYKTYRAMVRAKVGCLTAAGRSGEADQRAQAVAEARGYLHLAAGYHLDPALILMCGLPGTGKTWLARRLAVPLNAVLLSSDVQRKVLAGVPLTEHRARDQDLYSAGMSRRTYESLRRRAVRALGEGRSVIVDATFQRAAHREPFVQAAAEAGRRCVLVHVQASEERVRRWLQARRDDPRAVSDADLSVHQELRRSFEPPREMGASRRVEFVSGEAPPEEAAAALLERLLPGV